ncbi:MAG: CoA ester lyase [Acidobacteriota bacterium]|nr:CoA ester lyase [Acidobacteriota bacterium]
MKTFLRRSALYVPGDSRKMLQRSAAVPADMLLLNLEDGVSSAQKQAARENIADALRRIDFGGRETVVRINPLNGETGAHDLAVLVPLRPDGICLPKIETAAEIQAADAAIRDLESGHGLPEGGTKLHAMIESAAGVLHSADIAAASPRMASLIFGSADYASDVRCRPGEDRLELLLALQWIATAARSAGIDAIDAPCFDLRSQDLLSREANQARRIGFSGKSALHPNQLEAINRIFDVTPEEIAWAEKILAELDAAENRGKALSTVEGHLIDNPHRILAEQILSRRPSD